MKKIKDHSDDDDYEVDDPDDPEAEAEAVSEEEWTPDAEGAKLRPQRAATKKRQHSEDEEDEEEEEEEEDDDSDSDTGKKTKRKRRAKKDEDDKEDEYDEDSESSFNDGETPKDYASGSFVLAKSDLPDSKPKSKTSNKAKTDVESTHPTLWRIDGKALLQKFLPFEDDGKVLYKSTTTYSGWQASNKDNYIAVQVTFKVQSRQETVVELNFDPTKHQEAVGDDKN